MNQNKIYPLKYMSKLILNIVSLSKSVSFVCMCVIKFNYIIISCPENCWFYLLDITKQSKLPKQI